MEILKKVSQVIAGIAFWAIVIDWVFLDGYYNPYLGEESSHSAPDVNREMESQLEKEKKLAAPAAKAQPIEIYAMDLYQQFQTDEDAARAKFEGKTIIVSGLNFSILENPFLRDGSHVYIKEGTGWMESTTTVKCIMTTIEAQKLMSKYGTTKSEFASSEFDAVTLGNGGYTPLKLRGRVTGQARSEPVELVDCSLFEFN